MENFNLESQMYKLHELHTELVRGKEQYEKAIPQYDALIDIIKKSGHEDKLPEKFIETTIEDKQNIQKGLVNINCRLGYIKMLFDKAQTNEEVDAIVTLTLLALGIGLNEPDTKK